MDGEELTLIVSFGDTIAQYGGPADGGEPRRLGIVYYVLRFTRRERQLFEELERSEREYEEMVEMSIGDDGPGIPETELASIRAGNETELQHGRGLGLWQLRWGVEKLNGDFSFETDNGTTIRIALPGRA